MNSLWQDLRSGARALLKNRGMTLAALLTLALGIGANAAIFSVVNAVLLQPLAYPEADRLVWMWGVFPRGSRASVSPPDFRDYQKAATSFSSLSAQTSRAMDFNLSGGAEAVQVRGTLVTASFFETMGVHPVLGRGFTPEEEQVAEPETVILSHALWSQMFGSDRSLPGQSVKLNGRGATVVGIMPAGFSYPNEVDVWIVAPYLAQGFQVRPAHFLRPVGRLKDGVTISQAQAEMDAIAKRLEEQYPESNRGWSVRLVPLREHVVGETRTPLLILLGAVGCVLLIGCVNVANLLLARASGREKEVAIRQALGASRSRLVRQLLTESMVLAIAGGAIGLLFAVWGMDILRTLRPEHLPRLDEVRLDGMVMAFTLGLSLFTGLAFGLAPALSATRGGLHETLQSGGRGTGQSARQRIRGLLVVAEIAVSLVLVVGAGLLIQSFSRLLRQPAGFDVAPVATTRLNLAGERYRRPEDRATFFRELMVRLKAIPGAEAAGAITELPLSGQTNDTYFRIGGRAQTPEDSSVTAHFRRVTPEYFRTMGIPLRKGRVFTEGDALKAPLVSIINEEMARQFFPGEDPIGKQLIINFGDTMVTEIVGVVGAVRHFNLSIAPGIEMYMPYAQRSTGSMNVVVRGKDNAAGLLTAIRGAVRELDPELAASAVVPYQQIVSRSVAGPRFRTQLLGGFAVLAMLLAVIGIYGVMSYSVAQRTAEIGLRMALGAQRGDVLRLIVGQGVRLTLAGVALGLAGAYAVTRLLSGLLFEVQATDATTYIVAAVLLAAVAIAASLIPARRALSVDPFTALRHE